MVAHMNAEALRKTIATGEAWYFSRSRRALWRKGETSGHTQRVIEMRVDCDQDAVWIRVEQQAPGACHTGRRSCFYRAVPLGTAGRGRARVPRADRTFDPAEVYGEPDAIPPPSRALAARAARRFHRRSIRCTVRRQGGRMDEGSAASNPRAARRFCLVLVKPSHYDDDGYVIQWFRSAIPSNSLAALYGLAKDCAERHVLGDDVDDRDPRLRRDQHPHPAGDASPRLIEAAGAGMVMLVGVQSNQFPRALDHRAAAARARHPGRHRRLPRLRHDLACSAAPIPILDRAKALGIVAVRRRGRGPARRGAARRRRRALKPLYNFMDDLPGIEGAPMPLLMAVERVKRTAGAVDQLRRRPRLSRTSARSAPSSTCRGASRAAARADDIEEIVRANIAQGLLPVLHHRRQFRPQQGLGADPRPADPSARGGEDSNSASSSRSTRCATSCRTSSRSARAPACGACSSGWRTSIRPTSLGAKKRQNKITEYRKMLLAWKTGRRHHLCGLHPRLPERHRRSRSCTTSR